MAVCYNSAMKNSLEVQKINNFQRDLLLLFFLIGIFFIIGLGVRPYITPSEARYIEIPRQILATGDWLTPHINGVQYFEKPPLFYWMQAGFLSFGNSEFWGRIATVLMVTLTCLVTCATGWLLYGRAAGFLAAGALATSILGYGLAHIVMLDAPVTLFLTCSIASFIFAQKTGRKKFYYYMYVAAALAVMSKGLIGIVIPALVIGGWIVLTNNWKMLKEVRLFTGTLLFLVIVAPWHILMAMEHPEFLNFYFIHEHFTRFISNEHKRTAPWWFFIAVTLAGAMPWLGAVAGCRLSAVDKKSMNSLLLLWIILPLVFFSSSSSKLVPYIFPIFPPLFILIGKQLSDWWDMPTAPRILRINALFIVSLVAGGVIAVHFFAHKLEIPEVSSYDFLLLSLVAIALFIAAILKKTPAKTLIAWHIVFGATLGITASYIASDFDKRTIKPLAEILKQQLKANDMVVAYNSYWQDLPVYLNRNVTIAGWTGELNFGVEYTPSAKDWMIDIESFWTKCAQAKNNVYVFMNKDDFSALTPREDCQLHELSSYGKTILLKK
jgi:4-amino-4-deoxy-L-arabinose transferase-like glycosyltransferase